MFLSQFFFSVGLSCIIELKGLLKYDYVQHCNEPWYNTKICLLFLSTGNWLEPVRGGRPVKVHCC